MSNVIRHLSLTELDLVSGAKTTLVHSDNGLHVYMTHKDEQFEFSNIVFRPDGSARDKYENSSPSKYHYEIIERMSEGEGVFHARIWK